MQRTGESGRVEGRESQNTQKGEKEAGEETCRGRGGRGYQAPWKGHHGVTTSGPKGHALEESPNVKVWKRGKGGEIKAMKNHIHVVTVLCLRQYLTAQLLLQVLNKTLNRKYIVFHLGLCLRFAFPCCPNGIAKLFQQRAVEEPKRGHTRYPVYAYLLHKGTNQNCLLRLSSNQVSKITNKEYEIVIICTSSFFYLRIVLGHYCYCTWFLKYQGQTSQDVFWFFAEDVQDPGKTNVPFVVPL